MKYSFNHLYPAQHNLINVIDPHPKQPCFKDAHEGSDRDKPVDKLEPFIGHGAGQIVQNAEGRGRKQLDHADSEAHQRVRQVAKHVKPSPFPMLPISSVLSRWQASGRSL